jgi:hypothetical protein
MRKFKPTNLRLVREQAAAAHNRPRPNSEANPSHGHGHSHLRHRLSEDLYSHQDPALDRLHLMQLRAHLAYLVVHLPHIQGTIQLSFDMRQIDFNGKFDGFSHMDLGLEST